MKGRMSPYWLLLCMCVFSLVLPDIVQAAPDVGQAAEEAASSGGYLAGYENADPRPTAVSWWSTLAYLVSLFAIFGFVVVMAYFAARLLGGKFARHMASGHGGNILSNLPLGPNRSICLVEMAGRVFLIGVTDSAITMLSEITDPEEIERLRRESLARPWGEGMFSREMGVLSDLAQKLPPIFRK